MADLALLPGAPPLKSLLLAIGLTACLCSAASGETPRVDPCTAAQPGGSQNIGLEVDRQTRTAHLHIPIAGAPAARPLPLLIALHGYRGSGSGMEGFTGFSSLADHQGFIVAYPNSRGPQWAIHDRTARGGEDVKLVSRLMDFIGDRYCLDRARVFVAGVSNGAGEAERVACSLAGSVRGVAMVAGEYADQPPCRPQRPVSIIEIHSQTDPVAPFAAPGPGGIDNFIGMWRQLDRCARPGRHRRLDTRSVTAEFSCVQGTHVSQISFARGGHFWPGATPHGFVTPGPSSAAARIWAFFRSL